MPTYLEFDDGIFILEEFSSKYPDSFIYVYSLFQEALVCNSLPQEPYFVLSVLLEKYHVWDIFWVLAHLSIGYPQYVSYSFGMDVTFNKVCQDGYRYYHWFPILEAVWL